MVEFSPTERLLLDALQIEDSPTAADASRVKKRVLMGAGVAAAGGATASAVEAAAGSSPVAAPAATASALGAASTTTVASGVGSGVTSAAASTGLLEALLIAGGIAGLGAGALLVSLETEAPSPPPPAETKSVSGPADPSVLSEEEPSPVEEPAAPPRRQEESVIERPPTQDERTSKRAPSQNANRNTRSSLEREAALLGRAQAALKRGDTTAALTALNEHRKRFPRGALRGERRAALSIAYCKSGDPRGRARAARFVAQHPDSPMVQRLRSACKLPME